ncbi:hypothetical protein [Nesterenkonia sp. K-15-9-6]|uniref:hypothetical protein n=1 Tax=Nesterenkonia sp. K-15-9-6 TaxID=3093918 RepID=UPI004043B376
MTLTPDTCITRARRCLETNQPRMAQLYMSRAETLLSESRERRRVHSLVARYGPDLAGFILAGEQVAAQVGVAMRALEDGFRSLARSFGAISAADLERLADDDRHANGDRPWNR